MSALPAAYVDIWPADGGALSLTSNNQGVLSVSTFKDIWEPNSGSFEILLPPGGPYGTNVTPQWVDILTPMSLVIIGMQRSVPYQPRAQIVMAGVITAVTQDVEWRYGAGVRRVCRVTGQDFSYFFSQPCAYCSMLMLYTSSGQLGKGGGLAENGLVSGPPYQLAQTFYNKIMAGDSGIMSGTQFNYDGTLVPWSQMVQTSFAPYEGVPIEIPCAWNYLALEGSWTDSFTALFPFPWYEFSILTQSRESGSQLSITGLPFLAPAGPVAMARKTPLPLLVNNGAAVDTGLWDALPVFTPDNGGAALLSQQQMFTVADVYNFFAINPVYPNTLSGASNQQNLAFMYNYASWIDVGSIQRYGYRPNIRNIYWIADPQGNQAQQNANDTSQFEEMISTLALVPVAFYEPTPLMANGIARLNLRPDIAPGVKFAYIADKAGNVWNAYVRSVSHSFVFGQQSTTTLGLARGLPATVYQDHELLLAMLKGQASRVDGIYAVNGSAQGIQTFNLQTAGSDLSQLSTVFTTPGQQ